MAKTLGYAFVKVPEENVRPDYTKPDLDAYEKRHLNLKVMSKALLDGGEIPFTYDGMDYELKIVCGVPQWIDTATNRISPCGIQCRIYGSFETNQDEFWKVFGKAKKAINGAQAAYKSSMEKRMKGERARISSLAEFLNSSLSPKEKGEIGKGDPDILKIYGRMSRSRSLSRIYKGNMEKLESDIKKIKAVNKNRSKK